MIIGIGTDLVSIARIQKVLEKYPQKFIRKILTETEQLAYQKVANQAQYVAGRFAIKEAFVKALGTGMSEGIWFTQIQIANNPAGRPEIHCTGPAMNYMSRLGVSHAWATLSHETEYALGFVVLESK